MHQTLHLLFDVDLSAWPPKISPAHLTMLVVVASFAAVFVSSYLINSIQASSLLCLLDMDDICLSIDDKILFFPARDLSADSRYLSADPPFFLVERVVLISFQNSRMDSCTHFRNGYLRMNRLPWSFWYPDSGHPLSYFGIVLTSDVFRNDEVGRKGIWLAVSCRASL